jgi:hypothetical protein
MKINHHDIMKQVADLWAEYAPDIRFMIFMSGFEYWLKVEAGVGLKTLPDHLLVKFMKKYCLSWYCEGGYTKDEETD